MKLPGWQPSVGTAMPRKEAVLQTSVAQREAHTQRYIPLRDPNAELRTGLIKANATLRIGESITSMANTGITIYDSVKTAEAEAKANAIVATLSDYLGEATTKMPAVAIDDDGKEYVPAESLRDDYDQVLKQLITHHTDDKRLGTAKAQASFNTILTKATTKHRDEIRTFTQDSLIAKGHADTLKTLETQRTEAGIELTLRNAVQRRFLDPKQAFDAGIKYKKRLKFNRTMDQVGIHGLTATSPSMSDEDFDIAEEGLYNQARALQWELDREQLGALTGEIRAIRKQREDRRERLEKDNALAATVFLIEGGDPGDVVERAKAGEYGAQSNTVLSLARGDIRAGVDDAEMNSIVDNLISEYVNQPLRNGEIEEGMYTFDGVFAAINANNKAGYSSRATYLAQQRRLLALRTDTQYLQRVKQAHEDLQITLNGGETNEQLIKRGANPHRNYLQKKMELESYMFNNPRANFTAKILDMTAGQEWQPMALYDSKGRPVDPTKNEDLGVVESSRRTIVTMNRRFNQFMSEEDISMSTLTRQPQQVERRYYQWVDEKGFQVDMPLMTPNLKFPTNQWRDGALKDIDKYNSNLSVQLR